MDRSATGVMLKPGPMTMLVQSSQLAVSDEVRKELMGGMWVYTRKQEEKQLRRAGDKRETGKRGGWGKERRQKSEAGPGICSAVQRLVMLAAREPPRVLCRVHEMQDE